MKTFSQRFAEVYNDEVIEGTIYRIDLDRVDVVPLGSTGMMRSLPITGDRDKVQIGDQVRVARVGGERVAFVGDVALGFDYEEEVTEETGGITPVALEEKLTDRQGAPDIYVLKDADGRVGINRAPDPQFDLDVAGSIRTGGYFVGPHALQLAGAKLIAHFDGPENNASGDPGGHMGQVGTLAGTYDFRAGRFNKALHLSPGATLSYASATAIDITQPGTLSFWRRKEVGDTDTAGAVWLSVGTAAPDYFALKNSADALSLEFVINATTLRMLLPADNEFHHYVLIWDGITASLYIDGVRHPEYLDEATTQSGAYTAPTINPATLLIAAAIHTLDDLASLDYSMSPGEVRSVFESNAPVFAASSTWGFRSASNVAWGDAEGLWAVSSAGNPAFGVSGVNGKAWGGQTLDAGDVLIGRGVSYARWDDSTGTFNFAADGSGLTNINGSNITTGTIDAARISATAMDGKTITGSIIRTSATNPRIEMNSSGLTGYDSTGDAQAYFGSDGKFYAGQGNIILDENGIQVKSSAVGYPDTKRNEFRIVQDWPVVGTTILRINGSVDSLDNDIEGLIEARSGDATALMSVDAAGDTDAIVRLNAHTTGGISMLELKASTGRTTVTGYLTVTGSVALNQGLSITGDTFTRRILPLDATYSAYAGSYNAQILLDSPNNTLAIYGSTKGGTASVTVHDNLTALGILTVNGLSKLQRTTYKWGTFAWPGGVDGTGGAQIVADSALGGLVIGGARTLEPSGPHTVLIRDYLTVEEDLTVKNAATIASTLNVTGNTGLAGTAGFLFGNVGDDANRATFRTVGTANLIINPKPTGSLFFQYDQGSGVHNFCNGEGVITASITKAGKLSTTQGISGAVYFPIPAVTVFSHNGTGNAVLGDHPVSLAPTWVPANAIAITGRLGGLFSISNATNWMAILKTGETGSGIYAGVVRADDTVVHNSDAFVCNCSTDGLASVTFHINGQTASSMYFVLTGYFVEL